MKKVIIVSPHFPPSNLAAVHRSRLFAKHLPQFGWEPIILTVSHKYYEEALDWNLQKLTPAELRVEESAAIPTKPLRIVGDIGLRGYFFLLNKLLRLIKKESPDFLYIPIPSFYAALLGRTAHALTGIPYGIDYIDPWVHEFAGSNKKFSRHWWSTKLSKVLEPIAVKEASLITGVAEGYYKPVFERNPHLLKQSVQVAMPYGGEKDDHEAVKELDIAPYLFASSAGKYQFVYAGAMLPKAYQPLRAIFGAIKGNRELFKQIEFHFIGTGKLPNDPNSYNIKPLAQEYGLWEEVVFEYPKRIPYLDVLVHLNAVDGVFVLGSTEPHYTPSKVYQGILSEKPVFAVLHSESTACNVVRQANAGIVLDFNGEQEVSLIEKNFEAKLADFLSFSKTFRPEQVNLKAFEEYSALNVTKILAAALNKAIQK